jgi:hypothetical protein
MTLSVLFASGIIDEFGDTLESQWAKYGYGSEMHYDKDEMSDQVSEQDDDQESFDLAEMKKSSIYRFFRKLQRYFVACRIVTSEVVDLVRSNVAIDITVATVPFSNTTSTPAEQNEYLTCEDFFMDRIKVDVNKLEKKKLDRLRNTWSKSRKDNNLFLHAEMQMALFYALNPQLFPIQNYIGLSKKCCWCCDFVLK